MREKGARRLGIPVEVCASGSSPGETTTAILHELAIMLDALVSVGDCNSVDLRNSPLAPDERRALKDTLGRGEVHAEVDICGPTLAYETAVPGIWWITHSGTGDRVLGEFIEVTTCPSVLQTQPEDLSTAVNRLRARCSAPNGRTGEPAHDANYMARRLAELGLNRNTDPQPTTHAKSVASRERSNCDAD